MRCPIQKTSGRVEPNGAGPRRVRLMAAFGGEMRLFVVAAVCAVAVLGSATQAAAQNWTGLYVGGSIGAGFQKKTRPRRSGSTRISTAPSLTRYGRSRVRTRFPRASAAASRSAPWPRPAARMMKMGSTSVDAWGTTGSLAGWSSAAGFQHNARLLLVHSRSELRGRPPRSHRLWQRPRARLRHRRPGLGQHRSAFHVEQSRQHIRTHR